MVDTVSHKQRMAYVEVQYGRFPTDTHSGLTEDQRTRRLGKAISGGRSSPIPCCQQLVEFSRLSRHQLRRIISDALSSSAKPRFGLICHALDLSKGRSRQNGLMTM
jgi:hypothetical protein